MPRTARLVAPGMTYHLTTLGTGGEPIFRSQRDREYFLDLVASVVDRLRWTCLSYCLMTTHYHLVVRTAENDLDRGMHRLNACHAQSFNRRYKRRGHLFAERFHSELIRRNGHLLESIRYVANNPVRAGICRAPEHWRWSSYAAAIGLAEPLPFVSEYEVLALFGRDAALARRRLRRFVEETL
jgi:putative transposase